MPRNYHSERRAEAARRTRAQIVSAGFDLFRRNGYENTTIRAVAERAGVAFDTVFTVVGRKHVLFQEVVEAAISLDDHPLPIAERAFMAAFDDADSALGLISAFVLSAVRTYEHMGSLLVTLEVLAAKTPALAHLRGKMKARRAEWAGEFLRMLSVNYPPEIDPQEAKDLLDAFTNHASLALLRDHGWSVEKISQVTARALSVVLYPATHRA
jgi:AcrR family transcriptional regulator